MDTCIENIHLKISIIKELVGYLGFVRRFQRLIRPVVKYMTANFYEVSIKFTF